MKFLPVKSALAVASVLAAAQAAAAVPGYAGNVTGGGSATAVSVSSLSAMQTAINNYSGTGGLVLKYTGTFDFTPIKSNLCGQWSKSVQELSIKDKSNITILGADGSAANFGIRMTGSTSNIIIRNMTIGLVPGGGNNGDAIGIESGTKNIWIDHNELFSANIYCEGTPGDDTAFEGLMDVKGTATNITISYNYIHDHRKVGLDGSSDSDSTSRQITLAHNWYENVGERMPLQRFGLTHIYNNYYNKITTSGINVRMGGSSLIEGNYFENSVNPVTSRDSKSIGYWDLRNNNITSASDFGTYKITWVASTSSATKDATDWTTTKAFPSAIPYTYTVDPALKVKCIAMASAGAGKGLKESADVIASCGGTASSSSSSVSSSAPASSSSSSSVAASSSSSSRASSSSSSSSAASSSSSASGAPVPAGTGDYPTGFAKCADLGGTCSVSSGTGWVAFGRKGKWVVKNVGVGNSVACTVAVFGSDPGGNPNKCSTQN
ncbi:polysaccharide lyase family 1 protein [Uliginosibacterium sp. H3]|uniref:Polysaccharide lyase family 1 protein n=1 Tax=Uliginosibacterium silvisoli TaxID=3114758 RepID=A0ABU6K5H0_9RHOO|nr:polysaccharide lyase family 1 protein [Uliginosibacterium sp. H3]